MAFAPAAQISRTGVQLRAEEVMGTVLMRVSRAERGHEAKGSTSIRGAVTALELNVRATIGQNNEKKKVLG